MPEIAKIADAADIIVNGYAFTKRKPDSGSQSEQTG